jgi:hypothetical protein
LTPASIGLFQFQTPIRRKLEELEKHKRRIFSSDSWTNFWGFVGINYSLVKFLWANPKQQSVQQCRIEQWNIISTTQVLLGDTAEGLDLPPKAIP